MGWFSKVKNANDIDISQCNPIILNHTNHSVVLFLDRGVLYNKQVLRPGEAVGMTRQETAGTVMPYKIHAVVGDEQALPTRRQSIKNALSTAVIPTAFIIGTFMAASSAGTMTGPASALGRITGGMVVKGMVIDSAALAAGSVTANRAAMIADRLIEKHPENFSAKSGFLLPGNRFVIIQGGIEEPLTISFVKEKEFRQIPVEKEVKVPMDTMKDKIEYYTPSIFKSTKTQPNTEAIEAEGDDAELLAQLAASAPPAIEDAAAVQSTTQEEEAEDEEDRQLREAIEATQGDETESERFLRLTIEESSAVGGNAAAQEETEEDRQLRQAIAESLKMQEEREKKQKQQNKDDLTPAGKYINKATKKITKEITKAVLY